MMLIQRPPGLLRESRILLGCREPMGNTGSARKILKGSEMIFILCLTCIFAGTFDPLYRKSPLFDKPARNGVPFFAFPIVMTATDAEGMSGLAYFPPHYSCRNDGGATGLTGGLYGGSSERLRSARWS